MNKGTWVSPNGKSINQIDHLNQIERKHQAYVMDARSYRGVDMDTDHSLLIARIKYRIPPTEE